MSDKKNILISKFCYKVQKYWVDQKVSPDFSTKIKGKNPKEFSNQFDIY